MTRTAGAIVFCATLTFTIPATGAEIDHARTYRACMDLARAAPEDAFEQAVGWRHMGGGDAAEHCAAVALFNLEQFAEAARRFEALAQSIHAEPPFKASILAHAAQAWLLDAQPGRAVAVLTAALTLSPDDPELLVDRAAAHAALGDYPTAIADLDNALAIDPGHAQAYVFRASAHRHLDDLPSALADAEQALTLEPDHPEGRLERGILRRLQGDPDGARQDWLAVVTTAPHTDAARAARANLERMDVKPD